MKKAAKKGTPRKASSKRGRPLLTYRVEGDIDLELEYEDGDLILLSIFSHDDVENELLAEDGQYACVDAVATTNGEEWILHGRTDYHGSGKPIEIVIPKEAISSMRIASLD